MQNKEFFEVLDDFGRKTGRLKLRSEVHHTGIWHRAVHIWIINSDFELLIQQRSATKDINPGKWTCSCGGHVDPCESSMNASIREIKEELGVVIDESQLEYIGTMKRYNNLHSDFNDQEVIDVFLVLLDLKLDEFHKQDEEVNKLHFYDYNKLKEDVNNSCFLAVSKLEFAMLFRVIDKIKTGEIVLKRKANN